MLASRFTSPAGIFGGRLGTLDIVFLVWAFCRALAGVVVFSFDAGALVYQAGFLLDAIGGFFALRYLICDDDDIYRTLRVFATLCIIIACCMLFERVYRLDVFGLLGGVRAVPEVRNGSVRAEGPFQHELLAGTFAATLLPLFFLLWRDAKSRFLAVLALAVSVIFAPGTIAPDSSVTMPRKVPVCANKADEKKSETKTPSNNFISQVPNLLPCKKYETKNPDVTTEC